MKKLYMIFLGGYMEQANIEVHDTQFIWANNIESGMNEITERWYGQSIHIDGYLILSYIDGYKLIPNQSSKNNLYMVVFGGYHPDFLGEVHHYDFIVSSSMKEARVKAKEMLIKIDSMDHIDQITDVFKNAGVRFGLSSGPYYFKDNQKSHTYHKIIDQQETE